MDDGAVDLAVLRICREVDGAVVVHPDHRPQVCTRPDHQILCQLNPDLVGQGGQMLRRGLVESRIRLLVGPGEAVRIGEHPDGHHHGFAEAPADLLCPVRLVGPQLHSEYAPPVAHAGNGIGRALLERRATSLRSLLDHLERRTSRRSG